MAEVTIIPYEGKMTREDAIDILRCRKDGNAVEALEIAIEALEQEPYEMTAEEYRQRMIQAFRNADCGELIALVVLPTEKEFEHLEWLLEKHYKAKQEPKTGHWKRISMDKYVQHAMAYYRCSECGKDIIGEHNYCPNCGAKME